MSTMRTRFLLPAKPPIFCFGSLPASVSDSLRPATSTRMGAWVLAITLLTFLVRLSRIQVSQVFKVKIIDIYYPLLLRAFRLNGASLECLDEHLDLEMKQSKNKNSGIFKDKNVLKLYRKQNKTSEIFKNVMKMTIIGSLTVLICVFPFFIFELVPIILICVFFFSMFAYRSMVVITFIAIRTPHISIAFLFSWVMIMRLSLTPLVTCYSLGLLHIRGSPPLGLGLVLQTDPIGTWFPRL